METDKSARFHSSNATKGKSRVNKGSSLSTLLTKHNDDITGGTDDEWEKEDQTDEEMENLEETETNSLGLGKQKMGGS
eukprot:15337234-Ditylum_brightwellii.AAC.1